MAITGDFFEQEQVKFSNKLSSWLHFNIAFGKADQWALVEQHFGSLDVALEADVAQWNKISGINPKLVERVFAVTEAEIEQAIDWTTRSGQTVVTIADEAYPQMLREIPDPPVLLYVRGDLALLKAPQLAIVGSRHASRQGVQIAKDFAQHLSSVGMCITSGLAHGIDTAAHEGGLSGQGSTIAVIGTGIDRIYPASNQDLARQIAEQGAIVSEFPLTTRPLSQNFPMRNRIISGLATGTLVVEAALRSGSLITARQAMEQGREVFAIPGSINNALAKGCHQLIKQGAKLVETSQDILEELAPLVEFTWQAEEASSSKFSKKSPEDNDHPILAVMEFEPISLDELVVLTKMAASDIQAQMMMLELDGKVEALSAARWRRLS